MKMLEVAGSGGESKWIPTNGDAVLEAFGRTFGILREAAISPTNPEEPEAQKEEQSMDTDFQNDVMVKLHEIQQGVGTLLARAASAPSGGGKSWGGGGGGPKAAQLTDVTTADLKVKAYFEDEIKGKLKYNIIFVDGAGLSTKMGTWDAKLGEKAKAAKSNNSPVKVTFGKNKNGYVDISDIQ